MSFESKIGVGVKLTIQIVNFKSRHYLERCLFSIRENLPVGIEAETLLVNNDEAPLNGAAAGLKEMSNLRIHEIGENIGFGRAHNAGFKHSRGEFILFLNPDTKILPGALQALLETFERDQAIGVVGPLLVDTKGKIQADCFGTRRTPLSTIRKKIYERKGQPVDADGEIFATDWISGGAMLVRRDIFEKIGGFDENFFMYFEDVDLCLRAKKQGAFIAVNTRARIIHEGGKSFESEREKKRRYYASQDYYTQKYFGRAGASLVKFLRLPYYVKKVLLSR
jgi:GT2 family glycosyltransferase